MFGNKARRRFQIGPAVQVLESRALLAASANLNAATGRLTIQGTSNDDKLFLGSGSGNPQVYLQSAGRIVSGPFQISQIKSISASLSGGKDELAIDLKGHSLSRVEVLFGTGGSNRNPEVLNLARMTVGDLSVDARDSATTAVQFSTLTVTNTASLQFGTDSGNDRLTANGCRFGALSTSMGGGDDTCILNSCYVTNASMNLGNGDDYLLCDAKTTIVGGTLQGGSGRDTLRRINDSKVFASITGF